MASKREMIVKLGKYYDAGYWEVDTSWSGGQGTLFFSNHLGDARTFGTYDEWHKRISFLGSISTEDLMAAKIRIWRDDPSHGFSVETIGSLRDRDLRVTGHSKDVEITKIMSGISTGMSLPDLRRNPRKFFETMERRLAQKIKPSPICLKCGVLVPKAHTQYGKKIEVQCSRCLGGTS